MANYLKATAIGTMTRDIEIKKFTNGQVGNFTIAVNSSYKKADGTKVDEVTFLDCKATNKLCDVIAEYSGKGLQIMLDGTIKQQNWEKDGVKHSKLVLNVDTMQLLGSKKDKNDSNSSAPRSNAQPQNPSRSTPRDPDLDANPHDDIPF